jgi:hypothetical protein
MLTRKKLNEWQKWLLDDADNRIADDLLVQVFIQAKAAVELHKACLACLPAFQRMATEFDCGQFARVEAMCRAALARCETTSPATTKEKPC